MNILVAGGAGFIGSNLCASLIKDGHKVVILDNLSTGSLANIRDLEYGTYTFVNEDVRTCDLGHPFWEPKISWIMLLLKMPC